ncbi:MAG: dihydrofolate reductase [Myxococcota bacterium]
MTLPRQIGILVAVSPEGVIGLDGGIPWHYPADLKRFKRLTVGTTVIMGRLTWESLPRRPLPERRNIVVSQHPERVEHDDVASSVLQAIELSHGETWVIGGARVYAEAMRYCTVIDVTYVPDSLSSERAVRFPAIDPHIFSAQGRVQHPDDERLGLQRFRRREAGDQ